MSDQRPASPLMPTINIAEAVSNLRHYAGQLSIAQLPRLADAVVDMPAPLVAAVRAVADTESLGRFKGQISGQVRVVCQRCLQPMPWDFAIESDWTLVQTEADQERLLDSRDPLLVPTGGSFGLIEAIEDEVIMELPIAPMCEDENCDASNHAKNSNLGHNNQPGEVRINPFAALKGQIKS